MARENCNLGRDRLSYYSRLLGLGYSPERANEIAQKISRDIYSYRSGKIYDASGGRVIAELPPLEPAVDGDRSRPKLSRTKDQMLELAVR